MSLQLKTSKKFLAWSIVYSVYDGISSVITVYLGAKFLTSVTAIVFQKVSARDAYMWLTLLLGLQLFGLIMNNINAIVERRLQQRMELTLNKLLMTKTYELSQEQFDDEEFNTKLGRARDSLGSLWRIASQLSWMLSSVVRFVSAIGAIIFVAPGVGLLIIITVIPVTWLRVKQNKAYEKVNKKVEPIDRVSYRTRWIMIDPTTMPEIRLMNAFKHLLKIWSSNLVKSQDIVHESDKEMIPVDLGAEVLEPMVSFGATLYFLHLLVAGTIGLDRFIFLRGLLDQASASATSTVNSFQQLHEISIDMNNFNEIYHTQPAIANGHQKVSRPLTIEFKNVNFSYPRSDRLVLDDASFTIVPGSKLALVGENGAGKSTLIKLLLRQYLPTSGTITVNGVDIKEVEQTSYYEAISNLSQDFLMVEHLTIKDNLEMGLDRKVTDKELDEVAEMVGATSFIKKLSHGYNQRLDPSFDDGTGLSGGQTQRLGVARSLLRHGDIMILDEPTSAIDAKAEYSIFNNIYKNHGLKTTLIVSHRFSTVRKADKIIVMENGKIIEYGSHEELLEYSGLYREMFELQAEGYK